MKKNFFLHQKRFLLITAVVISSNLLVLGLAKALKSDTLENVIKHNSFTYTTAFDNKTNKKITMDIERILKEQDEEQDRRELEKIIFIILPPDAGTMWDKPKITDIDPNDNKKDIIVATDEGYIYRIKTWVDKNGEFQHNFVDKNGKEKNKNINKEDYYIKVSQNQVILGEPQIEDIDNDGKKEIIFGTAGKRGPWNNSGTQAIYVYNIDGTPKNDFGTEGKVLLNNNLTYDVDKDKQPDSFPIGGNIPWKVQVADIDGEKDEKGKTHMEIIASAERAVVSLDYKGRLKWMFTGGAPLNKGWRRWNTFIWPPQIADVTGDEKLEIVVRDTASKHEIDYIYKYNDKFKDGTPWWAKPSRIYVLDKNGNQILKYELGLTYEYGWWNSPLGVGDIDNDGKNEILFGGGSDPKNITNDPGWWFYIINPEGPKKGEKEIIKINIKNDWKDKKEWLGMNIPDNIYSSFGLPLSHDSPVVVKINEIEKGILWGIDDLGPAVSMFKVNLKSGAYTYDINDDGKWDFPPEMPKGADNLGDVHGTPLWFSLEKKIIYVTTNGNIIESYYDSIVKRYKIRKVYSFPEASDFPYEENKKIANSVNAGPLLGDIDGDNENDDVIFVTRGPDNPPGARNWRGQIGIWLSSVISKEEEIISIF